MFKMQQQSALEILKQSNILQGHSQKGIAKQQEVTRERN